jgi:hypothetical protein
MNMLRAVLAQNYFAYDNKYYTCNKGIAMGSPLSSMIPEIYLQEYEELFIKQWIDSSIIKHYTRYVDIFVVFDNRYVTEITIVDYMNSVNKHLEFKMTTEDNKNIDRLDLTIIRKTDSLEIDIFRKPSTTSTAIHACSNHPQEHKTAAYRYGLRQLKILPISNDR